MDVLGWCLLLCKVAQQLAVGGRLIGQEDLAQCLLGNCMGTSEGVEPYVAVLSKLGARVDGRKHGECLPLDVSQQRHLEWMSVA